MGCCSLSSCGYVIGAYTVVESVCMLLLNVVFILKYTCTEVNILNQLNEYIQKESCSSDLENSSHARAAESENIFNPQAFFIVQATYALLHSLWIIFAILIITHVCRKTASYAENIPWLIICALFFLMDLAVGSIVVVDYMWGAGNIDFGMVVISFRGFAPFILNIVAFVLMTILTHKMKKRSPKSKPAVKATASPQTVGTPPNVASSEPDKNGSNKGDSLPMRQLQVELQQMQFALGNNQDNASMAQPNQFQQTAGRPTQYPSQSFGGHNSSPYSVYATNQQPETALRSDPGRQPHSAYVNDAFMNDYNNVQQHRYGGSGPPPKPQRGVMTRPPPRNYRSAGPHHDYSSTPYDGERVVGGSDYEDDEYGGYAMTPRPIANPVVQPRTSKGKKPQQQSRTAEPRKEYISDASSSTSKIQEKSINYDARPFSYIKPSFRPSDHGDVQAMKSHTADIVKTLDDETRQLKEKEAALSSSSSSDEEAKTMAVKNYLSESHKYKEKVNSFNQAKSKKTKKSRNESNLDKSADVSSEEEGSHVYEEDHKRTVYVAHV